MSIKRVSRIVTPCHCLQLESPSLQHNKSFVTTRSIHDTGTREQEQLKIPHVHDESRSIVWRYNIEYLIHVIQNPIPLRSAIVVLILTNKMLDLREGLFNGVEIG